MRVLLLLLLMLSVSLSEESLNRITVKIDNQLFVSSYLLNETSGAGFLTVMNGTWHPAKETKSGTVIVNFNQMVKLPAGKVDSMGFYIEAFNTISSIPRPVVEIKEQKKDTLPKEKKSTDENKLPPIMPVSP